jgi:hypothetical protein
LLDGIARRTSRADGNVVGPFRQDRVSFDLTTPLADFDVLRGEEEKVVSQ